MRNFLFFASAMLLIASQALAARRVLYIGDSITDGGWGRSGGSAKPASERNQKDLNHIYGQCFVWQCAAHYQSLHPDQDWQFWNRGISGNTLYQMTERWADDALSLKPDVISILIGTNEAGKSISAEALPCNRNAFAPTQNISNQIATSTAEPNSGSTKSCVSHAPTYRIRPKGLDMSVWKKGVPKMNSERSCAV